MALSLRARLLTWVMLPLAAAVAVDGWLSHRNAKDTASVVQDRLLLGAARIVAEQVRFEDGAFQAHVPPAALELFDASDVDRIYYRVTTSAGQIVTGYDELHLPVDALASEIPQFFNATVRGTTVRVVALQQPVLADSGMEPVLVEMAQTLRGNETLTRMLWLAAMTQQFVLLALVAALVLFGLRYGLRPLLRLRDAVLAREPGALKPMPATAMPSELLPLVVAINDYAKRLHQHVEAQQVFIQNAAHQLRTPLTLLNTQISFATRTDDATARSESLVAIRQTVQQAVRLVNQLLTLSAAEVHDPAQDPESEVRLDLVVRQVLEDLAGQAQAKDIDLGLEMIGAGNTGCRHGFALREIAKNLVDNAIRYTPAGGIVTTKVVACEGTLALVVEDDGPGIPECERERVFQRFYRIHDRDSGGCGLGLAIVQQFATSIGGRVDLATAPSGSGLAVTVRIAPNSEEPPNKLVPATSPGARSARSVTI